MNKRILAGLVTLLIAGCGGGGDDAGTPPVGPPTPAPAASITIDKAALFLAGAGQSAPLAAASFDAQGAPTSVALSWTSSAPDKVSVDANGRVTGVAIGSAQIFAQSGSLRSTPTLVTVAIPRPGSLLLSDAQVLAVGAPLRLAPGAVPGVGSEYEVTLQGVTAPAPGTLVLATETAPVAGRAVASRQEAAGLIVRLAIVPLYELLEDYDIRFDIDLSAYAMEEVPKRARASANAHARTTAAGPVWTQPTGDRVRALAARRPLAAFEPFRAWDCDAELEPQLAGKTIQLSLENKLHLVIADRPGYSKRALEGSAAIVGSAGLKMKAGFKASGKCQAQGQIKLPVGGLVSVLIMPGVRFGLGAAVGGEVIVVEGELGVEGRVGFEPVLGWECFDASPPCRGLTQIKLVNEFKTRSKMPRADGMRAEVSGQFYVLAGLDAVLLGGLSNVELVEGRIGPKQSFDLAFEKDQASREDYASSYDLKLEGVVEPGDGLKEAIKKVIDDKNVGFTIKAEFKADISESPKGTLSLDRTRVRPGEKVEFTVGLDPKTVNYFLLDYNVTGLYLYRKRDDELEFSEWKAMALDAAGNRATYAWTPTVSDAGNYEFAAFVDTQKIPVPLLEIAPNTIKPLQVSCFSAAPQGAGPGKRAQGTRPGPLAAVCADSWTGSATLVAVTPSLETASITSRSTITWTHDPATSTPGYTYYTATGGSFELAFNDPVCTVELSPNTFTIVPEPTPLARLSIIDNGFIAPNYGFGAQQRIDFTATFRCPGQPDKVSEVRGFLAQFAYGTGPYTPGQTQLSGSYSDGAISTTWDFSRP